MWQEQNPSSSFYNQFENIRKKILLRLGHPVIRVEITAEMINQGILEAISLWFKRSAYISYSMRKVFPQQNIVTIPDDIRPQYIDSVIFKPNVIDQLSRAFLMVGDFDELGRYIYPMQTYQNLLNDFDMVSYYLTIQRLEDFRKIIGIDRWWDFFGNDKIVLYPSSTEHGEVGLVYRTMPTAREIEDEQWIFEYALAVSKLTLATVRGKLTGFQSTGGNIYGDAESMKAEAREDIQKLKEELNLLQRPLPFLQG